MRTQHKCHFIKTALQWFCNAVFLSFPLHGRVEIVDHNPDLRVEIVDHNPDIYVMAHYPCDCGEYELVDHNPDLRIELVDHNPDLTVEVRDHHPHINR